MKAPPFWVVLLFCFDEWGVEHKIRGSGGDPGTGAYTGVSSIFAEGENAADSPRLHQRGITRTPIIFAAVSP